MVYICDTIVLLISTILAVVAIMGVQHFPMVTNGRPDIGFWPISISLLLLILCLVHFLTYRKGKKENKKDDIDLAKVKSVASFGVFFTIMVLAVGNIVGFLLGQLIFLAASFKIWNEVKTRNAIIISISLIAFVYLSFTVALQMTFPTGIW